MLTIMLIHKKEYRLKKFGCGSSSPSGPCRTQLDAFRFFYFGTLAQLYCTHLHYTHCVPDECAPTFYKGVLQVPSDTFLRLLWLLIGIV